MNCVSLDKAGLQLRAVPPRTERRFFPLPVDYNEAISAIQKLRGGCYVADGAIPISSLDAEGRHRSDDDEQSYHLTLWNGRMHGCLRIQLHEAERGATNYHIYGLIKRMPSELSALYLAAMDEFIRHWTGKGYRLGETGGWAISDLFRLNRAAMSLPIAGWSFARMCTKQVWLASATERNGSAEMLKRIGGWRLRLGGEELPPFFDTFYNCRMELLCFCSEVLNPKFEVAVADLQAILEKQIFR